MGSVLTALIAAIGSATSNTNVANMIGQHMVSQGNMRTTVQALLAMANPESASRIAGQLAVISGIPTTITPLLQELSLAKDQPTINTIVLQINAALNANHGVLGGILAAL